jgi:dihydroorotase
VRQAKNEGVNITCEVAPHHFALTDTAVEGYDTNTKMAPPLRAEKHLKAVIEGIKDGTIDAIATDHAPHHVDEKALEYDKAPFGIIGLETALSLAMDKLVNKEFIDLEKLIELLSSNPAKIFKLEGRGTLKKGAFADITVIDPELEWNYDVNDSKSKSRNTPFDGKRFKGAVVATIVKGALVYKRKMKSHLK